MRSFMGSMGVLGLGLVTACAVDAQREQTTVSCPAALRSGQGLSPQGITAQGFSPQGVSVQGFSPQGVSVQGFSPQGVSAQGMTAQGVSVQGFSPQGVSAQGMTAQGVSAQGMQAQGMQAQGMQAQGVSPQGIQAQGLSPQGMQSQGLQAQGMNAQGLSPQGVDTSTRGIDPSALRGLALTGLTEAEASSWVAGEREIMPQNVLSLTYADGVLGARTLGGAVLPARALAGILLPFLSTDGDVLWFAVADVTTHPTASDLLLYTLTVGGQNVCGEGVGGLFVPGIWDESGKRHDSVASGVDTSFSCTTGVIAKCVAWGYRPWTQGEAIHEACTRMARADYCGDGVPHTENGTMIDMYDVRGIQTPVANDGMTFEAGWGPNGAVCVREPRYVDATAAGEIIYPSCWADLPTCATFEEAQELGAELGNDSSHRTRQVACE
jgi:hypothetical protein